MKNDIIIRYNNIKKMETNKERYILHTVGEKPSVLNPFSSYIAKRKEAEIKFNKYWTDEYYKCLKERDISSKHCTRVWFVIESEVDSDYYMEHITFRKSD